MVAVAHLMDVSRLHPGGAVAWGEPVPEAGPGVYLISSTADAQDLSSPFDRCPLSSEAVHQLLTARPELRVDGVRPTVDDLSQRLASLWVPNEPVLYVGLGSSLSKRVSQYYRTPLGARSPHAGGWPIKTLAILDVLTVHWAPATDPAATELALLDAFVAALPQATRSQVCDPELPLPFANLERTKRHRKRHGISGARAPGVSSSKEHPPQTPPVKPTTRGKRLTPGPETQRVTSKDILGGRIRLPAGAKALLPSRRCHLLVSLRGYELTASYDPRNGRDRTRSGVLQIGVEALQHRVHPDERLTVRVEEECVYLD